ncbi:MAG: rod shape-determining protein RodA [Gammaproteobacteria bacterium]|nr:rod shape-determining protein RodA [Gammaproteobacteria bacterium]
MRGLEMGHALKAAGGLSLLLFGATAFAAEPELYFITPVDGAVVESPVTVRFGLKNFGVAPAGVEKAGTGHHHLVVDADLPPLDQPIPATENYIHFGGGQTETSVELEPGKHTLQLLMGDHRHIPHDTPVVSEKITITVK